MFPVTQVNLSDALGLSIVHTNRTLQALRADEVEFDAAYLHLPPAY